MAAHPVMDYPCWTPIPPTRRGTGSLAGRTWIDLVDPTAAERAAFETAFGLRVPAKDELGEIEATSRLQIDKGALYMTAPLIFAAEASRGFRCRPASCCRNRCLLTVRSGKSAAFDAWRRSFAGAKTRAEQSPSSASSRNWSTIWPIFSK